MNHHTPARHDTTRALQQETAGKPNQHSMAQTQREGEREREGEQERESERERGRGGRIRKVEEEGKEREGV